ncbi:MAG: hypothetical protein HY673_22625 [Chloroflexi bacterium]|nr:hypothetical protein [Chloroflexota bacterium]
MYKLSDIDVKFACEFLRNRKAYHQHKEQMAYIGFLAQAAFFTATVTSGAAPARFSQPILAFAVVFWLSLHLFMRWQLRLRRYAPLQVA